MGRITDMHHFFSAKKVVSSLSIAMLIFIMCEASAKGKFEQTHDLTLIENMQTEAAYASKLCVPIVILVSQFACAHCEKLRQKVLLPLLKSGEFDDKALFRELLIDSEELVTDLNGKPSNGMQLAKEYIENLVTPTMLILDPSGNEVAERIVGISNIDFYSRYLEAEINAAHRKLNSICLQNAGEK